MNFETHDNIARCTGYTQVFWSDAFFFFFVTGSCCVRIFILLFAADMRNAEHCHQCAFYHFESVTAGF